MKRVANFYKNTVRINIISFLLCAILNCPAFCLHQLPSTGGGSPQAGSAARNINDSYRDLSLIINNNLDILNNFSVALMHFNRNLQSPPSGNQSTLINRLELMYQNIGISIDNLPANDPLKSRLQNTRNLVFSRLKRAKIDKEYQNGNLVDIGGLDVDGIPNSVKNVLVNLMGSVFHVIYTENGQRSVRRIGSGIALPPLGIINNATTGLAGQNLSIVLTCAHVLKAPNHKKIEVYFVPNRALHACGWPKPLYLGGHFNNNSLLNFLTTHNESFRLNPYTIKRANAAPQNFQEGTQPQYFSKEDAVIANISLRHNQPPLSVPAGNPVNIRLISTDVNISHHLENLRQTNSPYYAIGNPGMHHHASNNYIGLDPLNPEPPAYIVWINNIKNPAPLMVSKAFARDGHHPNNNFPRLSDDDQKILHTALTAKGMSGGSIISIRHGAIPTLQVFGVIIAGNPRYNLSTYWE